MRIRPCFVSIHGIDGTGKTSTAIKLMKILSQENQNIEMFNMGATYVGYLNNFGESLCDDLMSGKHTELYKNRQPEEIRQIAKGLLANVSLWAKSDQIKSQISKGNVVIGDRFHHDLCANITRGRYAKIGQIAESHIYDDLESGKIVKPDLEVLLTVSEDIRIKRIMLRENPSHTDMIRNSSGTYHDYYERYVKSHLCPHHLIIDTTHQTIEQVAGQIYEAMIGLGEGKT